MEANQNNNEESSEKIAKKFDATIKKLAAIVKGDANLFQRKKVDNEALGEIVDDLLKERKEKKAVDIKNELTVILDKYAELNSEINKKKRELEELSKNKKKEFIKACDQIFARVENMGQLEKDFYQALNVAAEGNQPEEEAVAPTE